MSGPLSNARHERFAQALADGETADAAYEIAGYRPNRGNAATLKAKQNIRNRVDEILGAAAARAEIDQAYVLSTIVETVERCKQARPVLDRKGDPVLTELPDGNAAPAYAFDSRAVLKGSELLGKHLGMFTEKHEVTGKDGGPIETRDVSDEEAVRRMLFVIARARRDRQPTIQ